jgi:hypothetical protein
MDAGCASDWIWQWRWLDKLDCAGYLRHPFAKSVVFYKRMFQVASTGLERKEAHPELKEPFDEAMIFILAIWDIVPKKKASLKEME